MFHLSSWNHLEISDVVFFVISRLDMCMSLSRSLYMRSAHCAVLGMTRSLGPCKINLQNNRKSDPRIKYWSALGHGNAKASAKMGAKSSQSQAGAWP